MSPSRRKKTNIKAASARREQPNRRKRTGPAEPCEIDPSRLRFVAATPARWADLEKLFGERGACGGCWCMVWRLPRKEWVAGKGAKNKRALRKIVAAGERPGVLAYVGRQPVGWCAVAPRERYPALGRSRVLRPVDDQPVWSVSCLFVLRPYRRQGLSARLLEAAVELAGTCGARIVEGYPVRATMQRTPDPFLWTGVPSAFRRAGFREAARRSSNRPIMRYVLDRGARTGAAKVARGGRR